MGNGRWDRRIGMEYGVIFDLDGTLVDSERIALESWNQTVRYYGLSFEKGFRDELIGGDLKKADQKMEKALPQGITFAEFHQREQQCFWKLLEQQGLPLKKGSMELLKALREKNISYALATSSVREKLDRYNVFFPLYSLFEILVSGDMVEYGKPNPEIYLKAAGFMKTDIKNCYIVEDSPNGIHGAAAAGGMVVGIPDLIPYGEKELEQCSLIFRDLSELKEYLKV